LAHTFPERRIGSRPKRGGCISIFILVTVLVMGSRLLSSWTIDYQWWKEMGQLRTWFSMLAYGVVPTAAATILGFLVFWIAHARALKHAGTGLGRYPLYAKLSTLALFLLALMVSVSTMDTWTVVRYFGGKDLGEASTAWHDPSFGNPLAFYLFKIPFYSDLLSWLLTIVVMGSLIYWLVGRAWQFRASVPDWSNVQEINLKDLGLAGGFESKFLRGMGAVFLIALAVRFFLGRYGMLLDTHGSFMVGIDYVDQNIALPLQWVLIVSAVLSAIALLFGKWRIALLVVLAFIIRNIVPGIVTATYVRPNEISMERPFIERHIAATRSAYGIDQRTRELDFPAKPAQQIDFARHKPLLDNVRLWDWHAFHDAITQLQPYRPYIYSNTDVDRYTINGELRQVMLSPRELDLSQLGDARSTWINPHFIYTHGYGIVMAEANQVSPNGLPVLFIQNAPPEVSVPGLKFTRPELYYGENVHDPVFVRSAQPEFNYPAGDHNAENRYDGKGGIPISSLPLRMAAAVSRGDWNILLTGYLTPESRMMIQRNVRQRLNTLANFLSWDPDPYLVLTGDGRLVWIVDGYMTSHLHPYSRSIELEGIGAMNYIRNSVKATVDAYDGTVHLYVFDEDDQLLQAYRNLFPNLFEPSTAMPADLRKHVRYPEVIFEAQADIYRLFHMRDPDTFYNKSDAWDTAKFTNEQGAKPGPIAPTYVVATLPGEDQPEFLLMIPFTPRNRDNLIGLMMARCDGEHLGEKIVFLLSKQEIILGPMQVEARINQDQNISKDLTLWNQQGSQVLRGQMLVLPVEHTFLYVEPIYIQASQAKMPQLKKVALAMGNNLVYADTYQQALAQLAGENLPAAAAAPPTSAATPTTGTPQPNGPDPRIVEIRRHMQRYKELVSQGKLSEAGKELDAIQALVER
jgi:uncharacterized membrane protein (UPF0182 family)